MELSNNNNAYLKMLSIIIIQKLCLWLFSVAKNRRLFHLVNKIMYLILWLRRIVSFKSHLTLLLSLLIKFNLISDRMNGSKYFSLPFNTGYIYILFFLSIPWYGIDQNAFQSIDKMVIKSSIIDWWIFDRVEMISHEINNQIGCTMNDR